MRGLWSGGAEEQPPRSAADGQAPRNRCGAHRQTHVVTRFNEPNHATSHLFTINFHIISHSMCLSVLIWVLKFFGYLLISLLICLVVSYFLTEFSLSLSLFFIDICLVFSLYSLFFILYCLFSLDFLWLKPVVDCTQDPRLPGLRSACALRCFMGTQPRGAIPNGQTVSLSLWP